MFKYLFIAISLFNSFAIVSAQELKTHSFSEILQNSNSSAFTNIPNESSNSTEDYIEFDDFPDNALPDFDSIDSLFEGDSEGIIEKKISDFTSIPDLDDTISQQSEFGIDIHGHPSALVNGCVNVITGGYQEISKDFSLPGANPLTIQRNYFGGKCKKNSFLYGWQLCHGAKLFSFMSKHNHFYAFVKGSERHGVLFKDTFFNGSLTCPESYFKKGVTNCSFGEISAKTNFKNDKLLYLLKKDRFELHTLDQACFNFIKSSHDPERTSGGRLHGYKLENRKLSDGSTYNYKYSSSFGMPISILYSNREGVEIAGLELEGNPNQYQFEHNPKLTYLTTTGEKLTYHFKLYGEHKTKRAILSKVTPPHAPKIKYSYETFNYKTKRKRICKRELPDQRVLKLAYSDETSSKVHKLLSPSGKNNQLVATHTFDRFKEGYHRYCEVKNALGGIKTYHWDKKEKRLKDIETYDEKMSCLIKERFRWGDEKNDRSHLTARILEDGNRQLIAYQKYSYNSDGNVTCMSLYGNLTGERNKAIFTDYSLKSPTKKQCDVYKIRYQYDANKRRIAKDDGRNIELYSYLDNTELLSSHHTSYEGRIQIRRFYQYDASGAICNQITDDGSGFASEDLANVSQRLIKKIKNSPTGLPEIIEEYALNSSTGKSQFIRKTTNQYDKHGWMIAQSVYDSEKKLAHTLEWKHDTHGNIIYEKDALENVTVSRYDENDNLVFEHKPDTAPRHLTYDFMNRLICEKQEGLNENLYKRYSYDPLGNCVSSNDIYENKTRYEYDSQSRLIKTIYPFNSSCGNRPTQAFVRNAQGFVTSLTDANGHTTLLEYNVRGKPTSKTYPDGTTECYIYTVWGDLAESIAQDGTQIRYRYDPQGREIQKEWFDSKGTLLKTTTKTYNAFHLISETNGNGNTTHYTYNPEGRLASKKTRRKQTHYSYDTLGRCSITSKSLGNGNLISYVEVFDALNRVTERYTRDPNGKSYDRVRMRYDGQGNEIERQIRNQAGKAITTTQYDLFGRVISVTNALQEAIHTAYLKKTGEALRIEVTDPRGVKTVTTYNPFGLISLEQLFDPIGRLVEQTEYGYDLNGNKIFRYVTTDNQPVETRWHYNSLNQLSATIEAVGTSEQKTVQKSYNRIGYLKTLVKNDGIKHSWSYDALGRKKSMKSSDGTISYSYSYDLNDNLLEAKDNVNHTDITRTYDSYDQLTSEILPYGHKFKYGYDLIDNVRSVALPDKTKIRYNHKGDRLQSIERNGNSSYQQVYTGYDKSSNPTHIQRPEQAGMLRINYDLLNRSINTSSSHWQEAISYENHLLKQRALQDCIGENLSAYTYDARNQLLSENGTAEHSFEYDMQGNPIAYDGHSRKFNACNSLLIQRNHHYSYDLNGNRTSDGINTYRYDALDRLIEAATPSGTHKYLYDAVGRRVARIHENEITYFLWQKQKEIGSISEEGLIQELQVLNPSNQAIAFELKGEVYIPLHDVFGHVRALLDSSGKCVATYRYSAFGEEQIQGEILSPWRYAGKRIDAETGFIYFGARYYDSKTFCWLTQDPIGDADGPNLYAYVHNNPLSYTDPDGLFVETITAGCVVVFELVTVTWGGVSAAAASVITMETASVVLGVAAVASLVTEIDNAAGESVENNEEKSKKGRKRGSDNAVKGGPPRDPLTNNYLPDPTADGNPHTTLGVQQGRAGSYRQGATFENEKFSGRTDVTGHGRNDHPNPHFHPAKSPNSAKTPAQPIN